MKRSWVLFVVLAAGIGMAPGVLADPSLYVDSAPNVYGSPDWAPWWDAAKADVAAGTFTNLRTGTYPGTNTAVGGRVNG